VGFFSFEQTSRARSCKDAKSKKSQAAGTAAQGFEYDQCA